MTLDEAIKHCLEVAEKNEIDAITYKNCKEIKTNMYEKLTANIVVTHEDVSLNVKL